MIHEIIPGSSLESFNELETHKLRKSIVTTSKLKGFKRSFDIYHDMNIPRVRLFLFKKEQRQNINILFWITVLHSLIRGVLIQSCSAGAKISPIMYFVMHNSEVLSKILKIVVPF